MLGIVKAKGAVCDLSLDVRSRFFQVIESIRRLSASTPQIFQYVPEVETEVERVDNVQALDLDLARRICFAHFDAVVLGPQLISPVSGRVRDARSRAVLIRCAASRCVAASFSAAVFIVSL